MTTRPLGYQDQSPLKGAVVNILVLISVNNIVTSLPRSIDEDHDYMIDTIQVHNININENLISEFNDQEEVPFVASAEDSRFFQSFHAAQTSHDNNLR